MFVKAFMTNVNKCLEPFFQDCKYSHASKLFSLICSNQLRGIDEHHLRRDDKCDN